MENKQVGKEKKNLFIF